MILRLWLERVWRRPRKLCRIEPGGQRIRDAFLSPSRHGSGSPDEVPQSPRMPASPPADAPWTTPILWDHRTDVQTTMNAEADVLGVPKQGKEGYAQYTLAPRASRATRRQSTQNRHSTSFRMLRGKAPPRFGLDSRESAITGPPI